MNETAEKKNKTTEKKTIRTDRSSAERQLVRSNRLLFKKFSQYLVPTMVTYAAISLNEFADSMLVSNLLDSDAMAIVSLGMPLMLIIATVFTLLGSGGETVYAIAIGERRPEEAGKSLTAAVAAALAAGILMLVLGEVFFAQLSHILCKAESLRAMFDMYLNVLLLSAPFEIVILTFVSFMPAAGYPGFTTAVNVIANVVNIVMDYVYIRVFGMGVEGAAWATLTGYIAAALFVLAALAAGKMKFHFSRHIAGSLSSLKELAKLGGPDAMTQIGLSIQFKVCNDLATAAAGSAGVVAFSLCMQVNSVMSIFIAAVIGSSVPILAVLHGQRDYRGEADILRTAMASQFIASVGGLILLLIFAPQVAMLYNIRKAEQVALAAVAVRIYSLLLIPRDAVIVYYRYLKVIGFNRYSILISALDSFALVVPAAWIMVRAMGISGLWWAFPVTSLLLAIIVLICNRYFAAQSGGRLKWPLLTEHDEEAKPVLDVTITGDPADISDISETLQTALEENGADMRTAIRAALAVEELAVYASNRKNQSSHMDVLARIADGNVEIDFRSLGESFNPLADADSDIQENVRMLRGISSNIQTDYLLGMNSTRITIKGKK